jgi:hypothetical protein
VSARPPRIALKPPLPAGGHDNLASSGDVEGVGDIRGRLIEILADKDQKDKGSKMGEEVVEALRRRGQFFFDAELRDFPSCMYFDRDRKQLYRIRSDSFQGRLSEWIKINRAQTYFRFVVSAVETEAMAGATTKGIVPEAYWAARPGVIYLSNGDGAVVRITSEQVALVDNGTDGVLFAAGKTLAPWNLVTPADPFETCRLFREVQCAAGHGIELLRLWLYSLPTTPRSKPPLVLTGDVGSGKTRTAKGFAELLGIPFVAQKVEEDSEDDFWPSMNTGGLFVLDNADTRCRWLPDAIAVATTDGCVRRRRLYTNADMVTLHAHSWLCVTSANPTFASDAGMADRLLVVRLNRRTGETSDSALTDEIRANRDAGLSYIAQTLRLALADANPVPAELNARHPDFAAFAVRIGRAIGRERQAVEALAAAESDKASFCLENDPIAASLLSLVAANGVVAGTTSEISKRLVEIDPELEQKAKPRRLAKRFSALWPHLERALDARRAEDRKGFLYFEFRKKLPTLPTLDPQIPENPTRETSYSASSGTWPDKSAGSPVT